MKALFLDIDGVLNGKNSVTRFAISKPMLKRLKRVIKETGCVIILSSTWRTLSDGMVKLRKVGLKFYGVTPQIAGTDCYTGFFRVRGDEIAYYLMEHPEITSYAIVDDLADMLEKQKPYFVQTDSDIGLTNEKVDELIRILNRDDQRL